MKTSGSKIGTLFLLAALVAGGSACSSGGNGSGRLDLSLSDASTDLYRTVYVTIGEVRVHLSQEPADTFSTIASPNKTIDLLALANGVRQELGLVELIPGHYDQMRLVLGTVPDNGVNILSQSHPYANYVIDTSNQYHELKVPSGLQTGVKIVQGFDIMDNGTTELVLDFDASRSVVVAGRSGNYLLKPTIQVLDLTSAAIVSGTVTTAADQTGIAGALVSAQVYNAAASDAKDQVVVMASTLTDPVGAYKIFIYGGTYEFVAVKDGYAPGVVDKAIENGATDTQNFALAAATTGTLTGTIMIPGASAETFATVSVRQSVTIGAKTFMVEVASENIGDGGTYSEALPAGAYTVVVSTSGKTTQMADVTVTTATTTTLNISF